MASKGTILSLWQMPVWKSQGRPVGLRNKIVPFFVYHYFLFEKQLLGLLLELSRDSKPNH